MSEPIMQFFKFDHLPEKTVPRNAERSVALRKLLEAKDAAVRALIATAVMFLLLFPVLALAQAAAAPTPSGPPSWLIPLLYVLIPALLALHPLLMVSKLLGAHADDKNLSAGMKTAALGGSSVLASLDHFLEVCSADFADLALPDKRAAAIKHIEDAAASGAMPALNDALLQMGKAWVTGQASAAVDAAILKAPAGAVAAVLAAAAPKPPAIAPAVPA